MIFMKRILKLKKTNIFSKLQNYHRQLEFTQLQIMSIKYVKLIIYQSPKLYVFMQHKPMFNYTKSKHYCNLNYHARLKRVFLKIRNKLPKSY